MSRTRAEVTCGFFTAVILPSLASSTLGRATLLPLVFVAFGWPRPAEYDGFKASGQNLRTRIVLLVPAPPFSYPRPQR
jgi:hypothetical protein